MEGLEQAESPEQANPAAPRSRRAFFFLGALAGASMLAPRAEAQGVGRVRTINPARPRRPRFQTSVVNESVAALPDWTDARVRLVRRITMGATSADLNDVNRLGYQEYLNRQLNYTQIDDSAVDAFVASHWPLLGATGRGHGGG
jgi:hypothetical protein